MLIGCLLGILSPVPANAAPGSLDLSFGQGGAAFADAGRFQGEVDRIALQPDGKIVVVATEPSCNPICPTIQNTDTVRDFVNSHQDSPDVRSPNVIIVSRFNADGSPDGTFGGAGTRAITFDDVNDPVGVAVQSDGKIVVAGSAHSFQPPPFFLALDLSITVARLTTTGELDPTFGSGGKMTLPLQDTFSASVGGMALQGSKIIVAGSINRFASPCSSSIPCRDFLVVRFTSGGTLDTSFAPKHVGQFTLPNVTGSVTTELGSFDVASAVAMQPDGKIVVAGCSGARLAAARYGADGLIDNSFGGVGHVATTFASNGFDCGGDEFDGYFAFPSVAMAVQADAKIIVGAYLNQPRVCPTCLPSSPSIPAVVRYNPNGTLDTTFGSGGKVTTAIASGDVARATAVVVQPDGKIVLCGRDTRFGGGFILRYTANGQLDPTFGNGGKVLLPLISDRADIFQPNALALQQKSLTQGEILLAGRSDKIGPNPSASTVGAAGVARLDAFTITLTRVGTFALAPAESVQAARRPFLYAFSWTVPDPGSWHDLKTLELRVHDRSTSIIDVIYDVMSNRFSLLDESIDGPRVPPGVHRALSTRHATLHMADTSVAAAGPASPTVTLNLSLELKPDAAGGNFPVEVAATDIAGNVTGFVHAGVLAVCPRRTSTRRSAMGSLRGGRWSASSNASCRAKR